MPATDRTALADEDRVRLTNEAIRGLRSLIFFGGHRDQRQARADMGRAIDALAVAAYNEGYATGLRASTGAGAADAMREACLRLINSARYGAPSSWPDEFPRGWKPPQSWEPGRVPTPAEAAMHDNGVNDAWIAVLTGTRDENGAARIPDSALSTQEAQP